jgi:hypothetical protein
VSFTNSTLNLDRKFISPVLTTLENHWTTRADGLLTVPNQIDLPSISTLTVKYYQYLEDFRFIHRHSGSMLEMTPAMMISCRIAYSFSAESAKNGRSGNVDSTWYPTRYQMAVQRGASWGRIEK